MKIPTNDPDPFKEAVIILNIRKFSVINLRIRVIMIDLLYTFGTVFSKQHQSS